MTIFYAPMASAVCSSALCNILVNIRIHIHNVNLGSLLIKNVISVLKCELIKNFDSCLVKLSKSELCEYRQYRQYNDTHYNTTICTKPYL